MNWGYRLEGVSEIECGPQKEWLGVYPQCNANYCPDPFIFDGEVKGTPTGEDDQYVFSNSIRFDCYPGFVLSGEPEMLCEPSGKWSAPYPVCERIHCPAPPHIEHGTLTGDSFRFEDMVLYECDVGYEIRGQDLIRCLDDRSWSGSAECVKVTCPLPPDLANGEYMMEGFSYGDKIKYDCFSGYEVIGEPYHVCQANKTWSGIIPVCGRVECDWLLPGYTKCCTARCRVVLQR